jgi:hypothetical protein
MELKPVSPTAKAPAQNFTGDVYVNQVKTADNMMCHFAMLEGDGTSDGTTWLEPVTDDQYRTANE